MVDYLGKIKHLLEIKRIKNEELAAYLNKNRNTITNYLTGRTKIDVDTLIKIAEFLNVPVTYFFTQSKENLNGEINENADLKLKMELEICKERLKAKEEQVETLKQMIEILKNK